jgi:hypothetical protein
MLLRKATADEPKQAMSDDPASSKTGGLETDKAPLE